MSTANRAPSSLPAVVFENDGTCPCCVSRTKFVARYTWFRDHYLCSICGCIPRERAVMCCIERFFPRWRTAAIHEASPIRRGASLRLAQQAPGYVPSQFVSGAAPGATHNGVRCENLERLTFADGTFDLHVTQDVIEYVLDPASAFREIARTLKPGGMHIFTAPLVNKDRPSEVCARRREDGTVEHLRAPEFHGNANEPGVLVTRRWGYDICEFIQRESGLFTTLVHLDDLSQGIRADLIEVLITRKPF